MNKFVIYTETYMTDGSRSKIELFKTDDASEAHNYVFGKVKNPKPIRKSGLKIPSQGMCDAVDAVYGARMYWDYYGYPRIICADTVWIDFGFHSIFLYIETNTKEDRTAFLDKCGIKEEN